MNSTQIVRISFTLFSLVSIIAAFIQGYFMISQPNSLLWKDWLIILIRIAATIFYGSMAFIMFTFTSAPELGKRPADEIFGLIPKAWRTTVIGSGIFYLLALLCRICLAVVELLVFL